MKRLLLLSALVAAVPAFAAGDRAAAIVARVAEEFRAMGNYVVTFAVETGGQTVEGRYAIDGDRYYLAVGDAEVFADGATRREVDNRRREVTILPTDTTSRNILDNPVRVFESLGTAYRAELLGEGDERAAVRLVPTGAGGEAFGAVTVEVSLRTGRPLQLVYDYDGERVAILFRAIAAGDGALPRFDAKRYEGYEFIDFR